MRSRLASGGAVAVVAFMCFAAVTASAAVRSSVPVCKTGQASTHAHPCTKAASKSLTTTAPAATSTQANTPPPAPTSPPVPVSDPNPDTGVPNPDTADQGVRVCGCDADTILHYINPMAGQYELLIYNTSGIGWINSVNWL